MVKHIKTMNIDKIIYETTREIHSLEDKMSIATIFLFCYKLDGATFAELLYTDNHADFIEKLNKEHSDYGINLKIRLNDKNVSNSFYKTLEKVKEKYDANGYYKALYEGDEFAIAISDIVETCSIM
jgi:hypothetical protein